MIIITNPLAEKYDRPRAVLEQALQQSGSPDYWVADDATEQSIRDGAAKNPKAMPVRGEADGLPRPLEFSPKSPVIQVPTGAGMGLILPWSPPGSGKSGGWLSLYIRNKNTFSPLPFVLHLGRDTATTRGARVVFTTATLAATATRLCELDIEVGDLFWSPVPVPVAPL
jgi:hypothetical protein